MHAMTKGMTPPAHEAAGEDRAPEAMATPTVIWVHDGPVCVDVVDVAPRPVVPAHCRCPACLSAERAEWAARFL